MTKIELQQRIIQKLEAMESEKLALVASFLDNLDAYSAVNNQQEVNSHSSSVFQDLCGILTAPQGISIEDIDNVILLRSQEELHDCG